MLEKLKAKSQRRRAAAQARRDRRGLSVGWSGAEADDTVVGATAFLIRAPLNVYDVGDASGMPRRDEEGRGEGLCITWLDSFYYTRPLAKGIAISLTRTLAHALEAAANRWTAPPARDCAASASVRGSLCRTYALVKWRTLSHLT